MINDLQKMVNEVNKIDKEYLRVMKIKLNQTEICEFRHIIYEHYQEWKTLTKQELINYKLYVIEVYSSNCFH